MQYFWRQSVRLKKNTSTEGALKLRASNFFEVAVAVAIALFGTTSPAALATTVGVLTDVPVMLFLVKIANRTQWWFVKETNK